MRTTTIKCDGCDVEVTDSARQWTSITIKEPIKRSMGEMGIDPVYHYDLCAECWKDLKTREFFKKLKQKG